jgi:hypothetical protein
LADGRKPKPIGGLLFAEPINQSIDPHPFFCSVPTAMSIDLSRTPLAPQKYSFNIYQNVIIARILLSWFPGVAQQPFLRPLYVICDPFLNTYVQSGAPAKKTQQN